MHLLSALSANPHEEISWIFSTTQRNREQKQICFMPLQEQAEIQFNI